MLDELFQNLSFKQILSVGNTSVNGEYISKQIYKNSTGADILHFSKPLTEKTFEVELSNNINSYIALLRLIHLEKNVLITQKQSSYINKISFITTAEKRYSQPFIGLSTSGSTGIAKTVLHDLRQLINLNNKDQSHVKFLSCVPGFTVGGVSSFLWCLFAKADFYVPEDYNPSHVVKIIDSQQITTLSCPPTFLRFFSFYLNSQPQIQLNSLKKILYGSEPMDEDSLKKISTRLPGVLFQQKYASTEFGFTPFKSENTQSTAFYVNSKNTKLKIVDNKIRLKVPHSFLGYLESDIPSPIDNEGYFITNDLIELSHDGKTFKVIGRDSEWVILAGKKIHLRSIETHCLKLPFILDCYLQTKNNLLLGKIISLKVLIDPTWSKQYSLPDLRNQIRNHFTDHSIFVNFMPQEFLIETNPAHWRLEKKTPDHK